MAATPEHDRGRDADAAVYRADLRAAAVSLDGFIADDHDGVGPLFDWYGNGDVSWSFPGADDECRTTQAAAGSDGKQITGR